MRRRRIHEPARDTHGAVGCSRWQRRSETGAEAIRIEEEGRGRGGDGKEGRMRRRGSRGDGSLSSWVGCTWTDAVSDAMSPPPITTPSSLCMQRSPTCGCAEPGSGSSQEDRRKGSYSPRSSRAAPQSSLLVAWCRASRLIFHPARPPRRALGLEPVSIFT
jgi:hypothetical protein